MSFDAQNHAVQMKNLMDCLDSVYRLLCCYTSIMIREIIPEEKYEVIKLYKICKN